MEYNIVEIFESLQGEGWNVGMPSIFIRFGKCNLACPWCDTNYMQYERMHLNDILSRVRQYSANNIIITGGEPTIVPRLTLLLDELKKLGYFLAIETNGLKKVPAQIDYIAISPKRLYAHKYSHLPQQQANEVRIVNDDPVEIMALCRAITKQFIAEHYYLSPCEINGEFNLLETIQLIGQLNQLSDSVHWQLSLQTHKLVGIE